MLKKLWEWIKNPHGWALIPLYIFTAAFIAAAVAFTFVGQDKSYSFVAYIFYALAAVSLGYTVYTLVIFIPKLKRRTVALLRKSEFIDRLYEQYGFRTIIFAAFSMIISFANAVINCTIGIYYLSLWYGALGAYYLLLSIMRSVVVFYHRKKRRYAVKETENQIKIREVKKYAVCGICLLLLPLALSFAILEIVASGKAFVHSGMMIYVAAIYTFLKITMAVINFVKARRNDEMTVRAIRNINIADSLVSILALQTAMVHEFSTADEGMGIANAITGAVVCALTAVIGLFMIINGYLHIKKLKTENTNEQQI